MVVFPRAGKKDVTGVYFAVKTFLKESQIAKVVKPVFISILLSYLLTGLHAQLPEQPDTVTILSGRLSLKGLLWHPVGSVVFPAVIFCHGSYETNDLRYDAVKQTSVLGPLFAKNGYVFLGLFRQGTGLSKNQGKNSADVMSMVRGDLCVHFLWSQRPQRRQGLFHLPFTSFHPAGLSIDE